MASLEANEWTRRAALPGMASGVAACALTPLQSRGPVDREEFAPVAGIDQFVAIHGHDVGNPAMLVVHGGPGNAMSSFLQVFDPWKPHVTVINWDQRGAGKTFGRNPSETADITPQRLTQDGIEVAERMCRALGKDRIVLCGHSMGAMLGWRILQAGRTGSTASSDPADWSTTSAIWRSRKPMRAPKPKQQETPLRSKLWMKRSACRSPICAGPAPSADGSQPGPMTSPISKRRSNPSSARRRSGCSRMGRRPGPDNSGRQSDARFHAQLRHYEGRHDSQIPVLIVQGREDRIAPAQPVREFVDALAAPSKRFVEIAGGHFACFTNPGEFVPAFRMLTAELSD